MKRNLPNDLGGYQHLDRQEEIVERNDILVFRGSPIDFVCAFEGETVQATELASGYNVYRKIPCPGCRDDKGELWGEKQANEAIANGRKVAQSILDTKAKSFIPQDDKSRKMSPMFRGLLGYFPAALFEVAAHSMESDLKHNPGATDGPTWARSKSSDHSDCIIRHLVDAGTRGTPDRKYHLRALAWRALAILQEECEADGALPGVSSR